MIFFFSFLEYFKGVKNPLFLYNFYTVNWLYFFNLNRFYTIETSFTYPDKKKKNYKLNLFKTFIINYL
jgi:hypothetical protein